jgi:malate dehydrogenase (oxaloacetate-decarboxylating)(NADP+)
MPQSKSDGFVPRLVGVDLLHDPYLNKGTAFTEAERDRLRLRGLLPPRVFPIEAQEARIVANFRAIESELDRYTFLTSLHDRNETLFYRVLIDHIEEMMPVVYTPTVGEACRKFGHIFQRPRGLYFSLSDQGRAREIVGNWPAERVAIVVMTDGERILGLGDLGAHGMGIPIGKLALYTACAGVDPNLCLPVLLDFGTENEELLADPLYTGLPVRRVRGPTYDALVDEFITAVEERYPGALIQFEDFETQHAFTLLHRYHDRVPSFNDDIQGTAAVALAGLLAAERVTGAPLGSKPLLFFGAGAAATGVADLIVAALIRRGLAEREARARCWFIDSQGLVVASRANLAGHKRPYAHEHRPATTLLEAVRAIRPGAILGLSTQPQSFTEEVLGTMALFNQRPIIFALSNPTSKSECTAEQAYRWTEGRALFASGSPFPPVQLGGRRYRPGQGNNAYIFPGLGLGAILCRARRITDSMFLAAADALAETVDQQSLDAGALFPPLASIREVSARIACAVILAAQAEKTAARNLGPDPMAEVRAAMYQPRYPDYDPRPQG